MFSSFHIFKSIFPTNDFNSCCCYSYFGLFCLFCILGKICSLMADFKWILMWLLEQSLFTILRLWQVHTFSHDSDNNTDIVMLYEGCYGPFKGQVVCLVNIVCRAVCILTELSHYVSMFTLFVWFNNYCFLTGDTTKCHQPPGDTATFQSGQVSEVNQWMQIYFYTACNGFFGTLNSVWIYIVWRPYVLRSSEITGS